MHIDWMGGNEKYEQTRQRVALALVSEARAIDESTLVIEDLTGIDKQLS